MLELVSGSTLSNKKATVKSLTSKRFTDFLDNTSESMKDSVVNPERSSNIAESKPTFEKYSIIHLEPKLFEPDEIVDEAPLLFVGKDSVDPTQNLQDIIESYRLFKDISSIEEKDSNDQFRLVLR